MPIAVGLVFNWMYELAGKPAFGASGAEVVGGFLMSGTITGILMALFLNNGGGAWDNAKKFIETGALGGKRSDAHKAAVVGDTVGDPFKDTAGPSLHVLVKLLSTITLVLAPVYLGGKAQGERKIARETPSELISGGGFSPHSPFGSLVIRS